MWWKKKKDNIKKLKSDSVVLEILSQTSLQLNNALRGNFNQKAKDENLKTIQFFLYEFSEKVYGIGKSQGYIERVHEEIVKKSDK